MSIKEAIKKMGCEQRSCSFLDKKGIYTFCKALMTDNFCKTRDRIDRKEFYELAEKYGFCSPLV